MTDPLTPAGKGPVRPVGVPPAVIIQREAPKYWAELQQRLEADADVYSDRGLSALVTPFDGGLRVTVNRPGSVFQQTYTDLMYKRGAPEIRCSALNNTTYVMKFTVTPENGVAVTSTRGLEPMNPQQASEHVMQLMLETLERK
jgi:LSD1 subclass zinc finger protein